VQDPGNAGAILRVAEAFGATGAMFLKGTVSPYNAKAMRASAGSVFRLPLVTGLDPDLARAASSSSVWTFTRRRPRRAGTWPTPTSPASAP